MCSSQSIEIGFALQQRSSALNEEEPSRPSYRPGSDHYPCAIPPLPTIAVHEPTHSGGQPDIVFFPLKTQQPVWLGPQQCLPAMHCSSIAYRGPCGDLQWAGPAGVLQNSVEWEDAAAGNARAWRVIYRRGFGTICHATLPPSPDVALVVWAHSHHGSLRGARTAAWVLQRRCVCVCWWAGGWVWLWVGVWVGG